MNNSAVFHDTISAVAKVPSMYGIHSLREFICYFHGFRHALMHGQDENADPLTGFREFVSKHFKVAPNVSWDYTVVQHFGNTIESIERFMALYKVWKIKKSVASATTARSSENTSASTFSQTRKVKST